jgi:hypothetical protein
VTLEAEQRILSVHPAAVVAHGDQPAASTRILDRYFGSSGVEAVLHEFLNQRRGSLDHLPSRDLARHSVRKETNLTHFIGMVPQLRSGYSKKTEIYGPEMPEGFAMRRFDFMPNRT